MWKEERGYAISRSKFKTRGNFCPHIFWKALLMPPPPPLNELRNAWSPVESPWSPVNAPWKPRVSTADPWGKHRAKLEEGSPHPPPPPLKVQRGRKKGKKWRVKV